MYFVYLLNSHHSSVWLLFHLPVTSYLPNSQVFIIQSKLILPAFDTISYPGLWNCPPLILYFLFFVCLFLSLLPLFHFSFYFLSFVLFTHSLPCFLFLLKIWSHISPSSVHSFKFIVNLINFYHSPIAANRFQISLSRFNPLRSEVFISSFQVAYSECLVGT